MASATWSMVKAAKGAQKKSAAPLPHGAKVGAVVLTVTELDNGDQAFTVNGKDAAGNPVDLAAVAKLAVVSDTPATLTVDTPVGMSFNEHAVGPVGTATVTATVTANDGSFGPFSGDIANTVVSNPATVSGISITPGAVTSH